MNKYVLLGILALVVILGIAAYAFRDAGEEPADLASRYENAEYGYSIAYPSDLAFREYALGNVVFGNEEGENMAGVAEVRIVTATGEAGQSFDDAVAAELMNLCAADSPSLTFSCTGVEQAQPFETDEGRTGRVLYLRGELRNLASNETTTIGKGPYFVIPTGTGATASRAIVVHPPLNQSADEADSELLRRMAESLAVTETAASPESVEEYVRANISELSPEPEVLGGTFYVTDIEAHGGAGTVSYEDGHNAYTADFTYTVDEAGMVTIDSFTIRQ